MTPRARALRVGAAAAAGLGIAARLLEWRASRLGRAGLVDWYGAEELARSRLSRSPGALSPAEIAGSAPAYARAMRRIVPLLETRLGAPMPGVVERHAVVSRGAWAAANIVTFQALVDRLEAQLFGGPGAAGLGSGVAAVANRYVTTQQVGFLLGYLGNRVLGQYDFALLRAGGPPGRLLFVEENIRATAAALEVPLDDFRVWIALHETTHAFELEAHAWLRPYLAARVERLLVEFLDHARQLQGQGLGGLLRSLRGGTSGLVGGLLPARQRRLLRETQLLMSLLEGFSDWVMDEVGGEIVPGARELRRRFDERRGRRRPLLDRVITRLTGLDMKLEQYRRGERFVSGVAALGGPRAALRIWDGPHTLPSEAEFDDPARWLRRVGAARLLAAPPPA